MAATTDTTLLAVEPREASGSRAARRLRRSGAVPGVLYGGGEEPVAFQVDSRLLRNTLAHSGAVLELSVGDAAGTPVMVKDVDRHPVSGAIMHIDLLRVRMDVKIQSMVVIDLVGVEDAPGVKEGGVLEQVSREVTIEALPGDIPDTIQHDASQLEAGATLTVADLSAPQGVTLVDDPETVVASITAPRLQVEDENEIEQETEVIGEAPAGEESEEAGEGDAGEGASGTEE